MSLVHRRTPSVPAYKWLRLGTDLDKVRRGAGYLMTKRIFLWPPPWFWNPALGEHPQGHHLPLPVSLPTFAPVRSDDAVRYFQDALLFALIVAAAPIATASPSAREARFKPLNGASLGLYCSHPNINSSHRRRHRRSDRDCGTPGPNLLSLKSLTLFLLSPSRCSPLR